jgi:hypothetical protein
MKKEDSQETTTYRDISHAQFIDASLQQGLCVVHHVDASNVGQSLIGKWLLGLGPVLPVEVGGHARREAITKSQHNHTNIRTNTQNGENENTEE